MKVITEINRLDLIRFNLVLLPKLKSTYITMAVIATLIFSLVCWQKGIPQTPNNWKAIVIGSIGGGVAGMLFGTVFTMISILFMSTKSNGILGQHEYELTTEGLYERTSANEGLSKWKGISKIRIVSSYVLFQISGYLFHIIPKRSFESEESFNDFVLYAKNQWGKVHNNRMH